ncbi:Uncharacterised protein [Candidatus Norongarragalina meridionalis]|nr:Uncharacterised protein [Candidatus Norongarragalina meridionalis]
MRYFADLHIHSKYSRAVSPLMDLPHLAEGAKRKGLQILGTGDFTHPLWFKHLKATLQNESNEGSGLFAYRDVRFMLTAEVATFKSTPKGVKKVHHVIHAPSFEVVEQLNDVYGKMGSLEADGRPMFGNCSPAELMEKTHEVSPDAVLIPAHAWTPWFGIFGSMSGYNSIEEGYEEQAKHIIALETGMSSDPAMNWRLSKLDKYALMSNSDSHSPYPWRLGRECNVFDFGSNGEASFSSIFSAVKNHDKRHFLFTVEVDPAYGKYHYDGHRLCNFSASPEETRKLKSVCPVCHRHLTIGVENRVEELADRPLGFVPENAIPFKKVLPLHELVAAYRKSSLSSKRVMEEADSLITSVGSELSVLLDTPEPQLRKHADEGLVAVIMRNREGALKVKPGYDGEYGVLQLNAATKLGQTTLGAY